MINHLCRFLIFIFLIITISSCVEKEKENEISSVEMWRLDWLMTNRFRYSVEKVKFHDDVRNKVLTSEGISLFARFLSEKKLKTQSSLSYQINGRFVAEIRYSNHSEEVIFADGIFACYMQKRKCWRMSARDIEFLDNLVGL